MDPMDKQYKLSYMESTEVLGPNQPDVVAYLELLRERINLVGSNSLAPYLTNDPKVLEVNKRICAAEKVLMPKYGRPALFSARNFFEWVVREASGKFG